MSAIRFYEEIFRGEMAPRPAPAERVYVDDVAVVLERVWDGGGTVIDVLPSPCDERVTRATFLDPSGRLVEIAEAT
jgi:predicted enzyme related to lactoylglutathione lyase